MASNCKAGEMFHLKTFTPKVAVKRNKPANTGVDEACVGLCARPGAETTVKVHARENEGGSCISVHSIQAAKESKSCQGTKTEPWKNKVITFIYLLPPVIYFSPFVSPKAAVLLLERLHIPESVFHQSHLQPAHRTTPSVSILSKQE